VLQVVWLALFAWTSIQLGLVRDFNALTALIALRVLVIYFKVFGTLLSTGVGLIIGGLLTLLVGWLWRRKAGDLLGACGAIETTLARQRACRVGSRSSRSHCRCSPS
jgi:hypothetical protein